jgi:hypothetical protein
MKYVVEIGSSGMTYIPSFIKTGSGTQRLIWDTHTQYGDLTSLLIFFFQNKGTQCLGV